MIKAEELRKGNFVAPEGVIHSGIGKYDHYTIRYLSLQCAFFVESNIGEKYEDLQPLVLTEEWLKKLGFEHIEYRFKWQIMGLFPFQLGEPDKEGDGYTILYASDPLDIDLPKIKYVHQLQNLYFALTGEELK